MDGNDSSGEFDSWKTFPTLFSDGYLSRWVSSTSKGGDQGKFVLSAGKFYGDAEKDKGELLIGDPCYRCRFHNMKFRDQ